MTRYLQNAWYIAAWSDEVVSGKVLGRTLLDTPIALFRGSDGKAAAILDRCPHRFAPLSAGHVHGDSIVCGYHGLGFNGSGVCTANPHGAISRNLSVPAYPVHELHRAVWIWPGDKERADPALIPDFSYLTAVPDTAFSKGRLHVRANYEIFVDNIIDLSHTDYLHANTLGGGMITRTTPEIIETDEYIEVMWFSPCTPPSALMAGFFRDLPETVDSWAQVRWYPPGLMRLTAATAAAGSAMGDGLINTQAHMLTPETATTSHYFFAATRNYRMGDAQLNERIAAARREIFTTEDKPMLELIQGRMNKDFWEMKPMLFGIDKAPVKVRRKLGKLMEQDAARVS